MAETAEAVVAGRPLALAALDIHTVGAGGGSIAWRDPGGALRVGPRSAGADPGPACYGRGGEHPTVTDANLLLGRLPADAPLAGGLQLDREAAERAVGDLAAQLGLTEEVGPARPDRLHRLVAGREGPGSPAYGRLRHAPGTLRCAEGIVRVAEAEMERALRTMTVERGVDPRGFALMPFGGAGPLHAAALARALGMRRILVPRASGVLCALGLAAAAPRRDAARTVMLVETGMRAKGECPRLRSGNPSTPTAWPRSARRWSPGRARSWESRPSGSRSATSCATAGSPSSWRSTSTTAAGSPSSPRSRVRVRPAGRPTQTHSARRLPVPTSSATATATTAWRSSWSRSAPRPWVPPRGCGWRKPRASRRRAPGSKGPRSARYQGPRCSCRPAGRAKSMRRAPCACTTREAAA